MRTWLSCLVPMLILGGSACALEFDGELLLALRPGELNAPGYGSWTDWSADFDADGRPDIVIGAWGGDELFGAVQILLSRGGVLWISGPELGDGFGVFAGAVGDVDGDGIADLGVGAPYGQGPGEWEGGVFYLYSGREIAGAANAGSVSPSAGAQPMTQETRPGAQAPELVPIMALPALSFGDRFGWSACSIGDLDGDGYGDFAVGAPYGDNLAGEVHLFGGSPSSTPLWHVIKGNQEVRNAELGAYVHSVGDLDGDGLIDFAASLPLKRLWTGHDERLPEVWVYLGRDFPCSTPSYRLYGTDYRRLFGWVFAAGGDIDGDGYDDLIVGAPRKRSAPPESPRSGGGPPQIRGTDQGKVWLYRGGPEPDTTAYWHWTGENPDDAFGNGIVPLGDIDGDGYADIAVGAPENDIGAESGGAVYCFRGGAPPDSTPVLVHHGAVPGGRLGYSIAAENPAIGSGPNRAVAGALGGAFALIFGIQAGEE